MHTHKYKHAHTYINKYTYIHTILLWGSVYCFFVLFVVWVYYHVILSYILLGTVHQKYLYEFLFNIAMHKTYTTKTASNI